MKPNLTNLISLFLLLTTLPSYAFLFDKYEVKLKVVDETGAPVEKANVYIAFDKNTSSGTSMSAVKSITGSNGEFKASGNGNGYVSYGATKGGYYESHYSYSFPGLKDNAFQRQEFNIVLRRIGKPVPMYARNSNHAPIVIPVIGKDVGFDLAKFDWVTPFGTGVYSDIIFNLERSSVVTRKNYKAKLTITFSNKNDGIQKYIENRRHGSQLKLPRYAPESGYQNKIELEESFTANGPVGLNFNFHAEELNYILRLRSQEKDGKIMKAMYGKMRGPIDFSAIKTDTAKIYFQYYLNPDFTRNLEFDPKNNLLKNVPEFERVIDP